MDQCLSIRNQLGASALCCLNPEETEIGFRVNKLITYRGIILHFRWFEKRGISLYTKNEKYYLWNRRDVVILNCPPAVDMLMGLLRKEEQVLFLHSIFDQMMRISRAAARAAARAANAAADAVYDVVDAANAAADAVYDVVDAARAADTVYDVVDAHAVVKIRRAYKELIKFRKSRLEAE